MGKINWGRVFLCGLLTGAVWFSLLLLILAFVGRDFTMAFVAASQKSGARPLAAGPAGIALLALLNLALAVWAMWLYAAIHPRYGPGPKTAAIAGFALWIIGALADTILGGFGLLPPGVLVAPVAASLPAIIVAVIVGARLYKE